MRSLGWASIRYAWCPYTKGKFGHRHTQAQRRPCEGEGRDWGGASPSQGTLKTAGKLPEGREEAWKRFSEGANEADTSISGFQPAELGEQTFFSARVNHSTCAPAPHPNPWQPLTCFLPIGSLTLDIFYKWAHTIRGPLGLTSLAYDSYYLWYNVCNIHPCCNASFFLLPNYIPLHGYTCCGYAFSS